MGVVNPEILYLAGSAGARVTARKGQALRDFSSGMASFGEALSRKREKFSALKAEFPEGIDRKFINEDVREQLTSYVTSEKDAYNKNIKTTDTINLDLLKKSKLVNKNSIKLKILGTGEIKDKVNIEADLASKSAIKKLEKAGGSIQLKK